MPFSYRVTLFTPTYNRAYILDRLYRSVQRQSFRDFEWLIIDDGSTDNTQELVQGWIKESNDFPIRYYKVPNGGKCRAINKALELARGELFFTMDSDDYLTDDALEKVDAWEKTLPKDGRFCAVAGNLGTSPFETSNSMLPAPYLDTSALCRYPQPGKVLIDGERALVFYTAVHRQYPYPEFEGENFMTEAVAWNRMAHDGYKVRFVNDIIWVYEYLPDGLTKAGSSIFLKNPQGYGLWLREKARFMGDPLTKKLKMWYSFYCDQTAAEPDHRLTLRQCAAYIGAPVPFMYLAALLHDLIRWTRSHIQKKRGQ